MFVLKSVGFDSFLEDTLLIQFVLSDNIQKLNKDSCNETENLMSMHKYSNRISSFTSKCKTCRTKMTSYTFFSIK